MNNYVVKVNIPIEVIVEGDMIDEELVEKVGEEPAAAETALDIMYEAPTFDGLYDEWVDDAKIQEVNEIE